MEIYILQLHACTIYKLEKTYCAPKETHCWNRGCQVLVTLLLDSSYVYQQHQKCAKNTQQSVNITKSLKAVSKINFP